MYVETHNIITNVNLAYINKITSRKSDTYKAYAGEAKFVY